MPDPQAPAFLDAQGNPITARQAEAARAAAPDRLDAQGNPISAPTAPTRSRNPLYSPILHDAADWLYARGLDAGRMIRENPAQAGALAGGTAMSLATGGLGALPAMGLVGLAGAGGAGAGLATDQLVRGTPGTVKDNVTTMATEGASMAGGEGIGRGAVAVVKGGSRWLMNRAMNNMSTQLGKEFPELTQEMIDEAITATKGGLEKARTLLDGWKAAAQEGLMKAETSGTKIPITAATDAVKDVATRITSTGNPTGNAAKLQAVLDDFRRGRATMLTPVEADRIKTELQRESRALYLKRIKGDGTPAMKVMEEAKAAMAAGLNTAIDDAASAAGARGAAGYKATNAEAQKMIGVTRGVDQATRQSGNLYQALVRPGVSALAGGTLGETQGHPMAGAFAGALIGSPSGLSRQAILLGNPAVQAVLKQLPKPIFDAVVQAFTTPTPASGDQLVP